ncbi:MAG TPA: sugar ABC transporter substrate-binding protein [Chloroflexota bacterium]
MRSRKRVLLLMTALIAILAVSAACQSSPPPAPTAAPKPAAEPTKAPAAAPTSAPAAAPTAAPAAPTAAAAPAKKTLKMGVVQMTQDIQVQVAMKEGIEEQAKKMGVELTLFDGMQKVERQISAMENMIASKVDAIILNPADAAGIIPAVEAANKANIPVVTFDTDAKGGKRAVFVESDNHRFGQLIGEYLVWKLKGKGVIGVLDWPYVTAVTDRDDSFNAVVRNFPDMKIVQTEMAATREKGMTAAENILQAHPDITAFYAINDPGALGAYQAIKARGLDGKVIIATGDGDMESVKLIRDANTSMKYNSAQFGKEIGRQALMAAYNTALGQQVIKHVLIPVMPITIENANKYQGWSNDVPDDLTPAWYSTPEWKDLSAKIK